MKPSSFTPSCARTNFVSSRTTKYGLLMSDIVIYIRLDPYLAQWLRHEHFGSPIEFPKNSTEYDIIELGLMPKPYLASVMGPGENHVAIALPFFKNKDVRYNNYLPKNAQRALAQCIRTRFVVALWKDLYKFGYIGKRKQDLIWAWMEAHGIEASETNWNTIAKIYLRKRNVYREQKRKEEKRRLEEMKMSQKDEPLNNIKNATT
jgi:hypothetical protein